MRLLKKLTSHETIDNPLFASFLLSRRTRMQLFVFGFFRVDRGGATSVTLLVSRGKRARYSAANLRINFLLANHVAVARIDIYGPYFRINYSAAFHFRFASSCALSRFYKCFNIKFKKKIKKKKTGAHTHTRARVVALLKVPAISGNDVI